MDFIRNMMSIAQGVRSFEGIDEQMKKLKRKYEHLKSREEDVKAELEYAKCLLLKKQRKVVENWLTNDASIKNEVVQVEQQVCEGNLLNHLQLEWKLGRLTKEVTELDQQGRFPEGLTLEVNDNQQMEFITTRLIGETFQQHENAVWEFFGSDNVTKIGIYGMGGVGKTTLVTYVHNELLNSPNSKVYWVTVSQSFSILKLQSDIAKAIRLNMENEDDKKKRAAKLAQRLRKMNNFVLILDDVWQHFTLDEVGIPAGGIGFKVIITSRSFDVCRRLCDDFIKVQPLAEEDAWELFTEKLRHDKAFSPEIEPIAKLIVKRYSGLPLAIITMAGSLRGVEDISEWSDALEKMKEPLAEHDDDMEVEVFQVLKYSYDMLKDPKVQQCFLYRSLFHEDFKIGRQMLIEHFIDERIIDGLRSRQAELNRGHTILNKLENVCLLDGGITWNRTKYVKMHDLVRNMAVKIGRDHFQVLAEAGLQLREIPREEKWAEDLTKVSLIKNYISHIPANTSPNCPRLLSLMLNGNIGLEIILNSFFSNMPVLSVLDLPFKGLEYLPTSVGELVNLIALCLEGCNRLKHMPSLANLKELRRLNLRGTGIRELPQGMEMLSTLRYLNIEATRIEIIPDGILPKLSHLQYLGTDDGFEMLSKSRKARVEEIVKLKMLETLKMRFYDPDEFNTYVKLQENNGRGPNAYLLMVGRINNDEISDNIINQVYDRAVCLEDYNKCIDSDSLLVLPTDVQFLYVEQLNDASSLCDMVQLKNVTELSTCYVHDCQGMEYVVCGGCSLIPVIQNLNTLCLKYLHELRSLIGIEMHCICASSSLSAAAAALSKVPQTAMFSSLRHLEIRQCHRIKRLFTPLLLSNLKHLQREEI